MAEKIYTVRAKSTHAEFHRVHVDVDPDPKSAPVGESMTVRVLEVENLVDVGEVEIVKFPNEICTASGTNNNWEDVRETITRHLNRPTLFEIVD